MATTPTPQKPATSHRLLPQRKKTLAIRVLAAGIVEAFAIVLIGCGGGSSAPLVPPAVASVQPLHTTDVQIIMQAAVNSLNMGMAFAVMDPPGFILCLFPTQNHPLPPI